MPQPAAKQYIASHDDSSAAVEYLTDGSSEDFVRQVQNTTRGMLQFLAVGATAVAAPIAVAAGITPLQLVELAAYGFVAFLLARHVELRRRRLLLIYDLSPDHAEAYRLVAEGIGALGHCSLLRCVRSHHLHNDWKRNAGSRVDVVTEPAAYQLTVPRHVVTNISAPCINAQGKRFFFLPDRLLIEDHGKFAALAYSEVKVDWSIVDPFVWAGELPEHVEVVGSSWLRVRRDGGPDLRFKANRQIPLIRLGHLALLSNTGLSLHLLLSLHACAEPMANVVRAYSQLRLDPLPDQPVTSSEFEQPLKTMGLAELPSPAQLRSAYIELVERHRALQGAPRELQDFADERMAEVEAAYAFLRAKLSPDSDGGATVDEPPPQTDLTRSRSLTRRHPPTWTSVCVATVFAGLLFLGFRLMPPDAIGSAIFPTHTATAVLAEAAASAEPPRRSTFRSCRIRARPSSAADVVGELAVGVAVEILEERNGWLRVKTSEGLEGWTGPACWR